MENLLFSYFFSKSLISINNPSCVGPFWTSTAGSGFLNFAIAFTTRKIQKAIIKKSTEAWTKLPQLRETHGTAFCIPGISSTAFLIIIL